MWRLGRKNNRPDEEVRRFHCAIRHQTHLLITVANRAEAESMRRGDPESTDESEVALAQALVAAQREVVDAILGGCARGLRLEEVVQHVVRPVIDQSVVGDVASIAVNQVIDTARARVARAS